MDGTTFIVPLTPMATITPLTPVNGTKAAGAAQQIDGQTDGEEGSFLHTLQEKIQGVKDLETTSLDSAYAVALGQSDDIESAMLDAAKASIAIQTTTQITTRAVNAYKEIMEMQV